MCLGNPASRAVSTKPMESDPASDETFARLRGWVDDCLHSDVRGKRIHKVCPIPSGDYLPSRLIEISKPANTDHFELRLRETRTSVSGTESYAALSYCWGGPQPVMSTRALFDRWKTGIPWDKLPQTLKDAVLVCHRLGVGLLWVDATLCVSFKMTKPTRTASSPKCPTSIGTHSSPLPLREQAASARGFSARD